MQLITVELISQVNDVMMQLSWERIDIIPENTTDIYNA